MPATPATPDPVPVPDVYGNKEVNVATVEAVTGRCVGIYLDDLWSDQEVIGLFVLSTDQALNLADLLCATAARADAENGLG